MCEVLNVSRAGYYKWRKRPRSVRAQENEELLSFLTERAKKEEGITGYRKLWVIAVDAGFICSKNRVQRLLQSVGYRSRTAKKVGYQKPQPSMPRLPNLLNREFSVSQSNRVWVSDITQIGCLDGWLYIAMIMDLNSRRIIGWAAQRINNAELVKEALQNAWILRNPEGSKLLFHSDQGCQYRSETVAKWLNNHEVTISMSRVGNCWDNACAESFFAQLKKEWFHHREIMTREETKLEVQYYIEEYYNEIRRHGTLNNLSPVAFEKQQELCLL
jgi:putative transposase